MERYTPVMEQRLTVAGNVVAHERRSRAHWLILPRAVRSMRLLATPDQPRQPHRSGPRSSEPAPVLQASASHDQP